MDSTLTLADAAATERLAGAIAPHLVPGDFLGLSGGLGAGKSVFARALIGARLAARGRAEDIPSPSYTLVQTYDLGGCELWHADLYRLGTPGEVAELGLDEAFDEAICVVEWAERLGDALPARRLLLTLGFAPGSAEARIATLAARGKRLGLAPGRPRRGGRPVNRPVERPVDRPGEIDAFLAREGWGAAARAPLAGDASARRYQRLTRGRARAILMDVPPESGLEVRPFLAVTDWLRAGGFSAPEVLASDPARGLVLLEDFGDDLFAALCAAEPAREAGLYAAAVDLLAELQRRPPPAAGWTPPPYDMAVLMREARLFVEWYLPAATGRPVPQALGAEFEALAAAAFTAVAAPAVPILRDYHAENLIWLPGRRGHARVGLLDYQDMLVGHPAYDLVSLIEDARRDTSAELRAAMLARYLERSGADGETFGAAAATLAAQRNLKIMGLFTRLCRRDGKPRYLACLPRVWAHLARDLAAPPLAGLAAFVARHAPPPEPAVQARIAAEP